MLLPYIEQSTIYNSLDSNVPMVAGPTGYNAAAQAQNVALAATVIPAFLCASSPGPATDDYLYPANAFGAGVPPVNCTWKGVRTDYGGTSGVLSGTNGFGWLAYNGSPGGDRHGFFRAAGVGGNTTRMRDITDGTSNAFMFGERTGGLKILICVSKGPSQQRRAFFYSFSRRSEYAFAIFADDQPRSVLRLRR